MSTPLPVTAPANEQLHLLHELTELVSRHVPFQTLLDFVFENFRTLLPYNRIGYAFVDHRRDRVIDRWERTDREPLLRPGYVTSLEGSSLAEVLATGRPHIIDDLEAHLREHPESEPARLLLAQGLHSSLTCPLRDHGKPIGFLFFSSEHKHAYTQETVELFEEIADHLAWLIERSRLLDVLRYASERIAAETERRTDAERLSDELQHRIPSAADLQAELFPVDLPQPEGYSVAVLYEPLASVGGTFLDVIELDAAPGRERYGFVLADCGAGGHRGVMLQTVLRTVLHTQDWHEATAGDVLARLNESVCRCFPRGNLVAAAVALFDVRSGTIDWTEAGFPTPVHVKRAGYAIDGSNDAGDERLGRSRSLRAAHDSSPLLPGDKFVLHTPGLSTLRNEHGEDFGTGRLHEILELTAEASATATVERLKNAFHAHTGPEPADEDRLVLVIERHPDNVRYERPDVSTAFPWRPEKAKTIRSRY